MKIVREKVSKLVLYCFPDSEEHAFKATCFVCRDIKALDIKEATHEVITGVEPHPFFRGGAYRYDNGWSIANQNIVDEMVVTAKEKKLEELDKHLGALKDDVISPADYMPMIMKALKTLNKNQRGTVTVNETVELDSWQDKAEKIESINNNRAAITETINNLTTLQSVADYKVGS